jgi:hypothetical protein
MNSLAGRNLSPPSDPAPIGKPSAIAGAIEGRQRLAQLIGRLLARQWLRDRHGQVPDRDDPSEHAQDRPASGIQ